MTRSHGRAVLLSKLTEPDRIFGVLGVLVFSLGLWTVVSRRGLNFAMRRLLPKMKLLIVLGARPRLMVRTWLATQVLAIGAAIAIGTLTAHWIFYGMLARQCVQPLEVGVPLLVLTGATVMAQFRSLARLKGALTGPINAEGA